MEFLLEFKSFYQVGDIVLIEYFKKINLKNSIEI